MKEKISVNIHSSIKIAGEKTIRFDPFMIENNEHDADVIFVTHAHYDHFSPEDIAKVIKPDTVLVFPLSMEKLVLEQGFGKDRILFLNPGDKAKVKGLDVDAIHSYNVGKPMHPKENNWLGYVVSIDNSRVYVCGDMDINDDAKAVECDIAFTPIGGTYTMNAKEAAKLVNYIHPKAAIPIHYGSIVGKKAFARDFKSHVVEDIEVWVKIK